jgi:hypothetical protein
MLTWNEGSSGNWNAVCERILIILSLLLLVVQLYIYHVFMNW